MEVSGDEMVPATQTRTIILVGSELQELLEQMSTLWLWNKTEWLKKNKERKKYCNRGINKLLRLIQTQDNQEDFMAEFSFKQDFEE